MAHGFIWLNTVEYANAKFPYMVFMNINGI